MKFSFINLILALICTISSAYARDDFSGERKRFLQAKQSLENKDFLTFNQLEPSLRKYPLHYYLQYLTLKGEVDSVSPNEIIQFFDRYKDSPLADLLYKEWMTNLQQREDWQNFEIFYPYQRLPSAEFRCQHALIRLNQEMTPVFREELRSLWLVGESQPKACNTLFEYLVQIRFLNQDLLWQRIKLAMAENNPNVATQWSNRLTDNNLHQLFVQWRRIQQNPETVNNFVAADNADARLIAVYGLKKLAKQNPLQAKQVLANLKGRFAFTPAEQDEVSIEIAVQAVKKELPEALSLLKALNIAPLDEKAQHLFLQQLLIENEWKGLISFVQKLPVGTKELPIWRYWLGRALEITGDAATAKGVWQTLAQERDYYGFLAANRLNIQPRLNHKPIVFTTDEERELLSQFNGLIRGLEFRLVGMDKEARKEWAAAIKTLTPRQLEIAAAIARRDGWFDRAIFTASKAASYDDLEVRFPLAYHDIFSEGAQEQGVDLAWVYGIVRQESAFMDVAISHAGAKGLMQLMPATAKTVANSIGLKLSDIYDERTNVKLGTTFLRQLLDKFDGNYMLATAAYNAGPGRSKSWAATNPCIAPDMWVELVPFTETRNYVKYVLTYTAIYEGRLDRAITPVRISRATTNCPTN
jgi:soluble lytic murein transglycosylase